MLTVWVLLGVHADDGAMLAGYDVDRWQHAVGGICLICTLLLCLVHAELKVRMGIMYVPGHAEPAVSMARPQ